MYLCLSDETLKAVGPFYLVSISTGALEFGLEKKCRKLIFSGYISGLPLIENLMSPQKSPLRVLHNLHIN